KPWAWAKKPIAVLAPVPKALALALAPTAVVCGSGAVALQLTPIIWFEVPDAHCAKAGETPNTPGAAASAATKARPRSFPRSHARGPRGDPIASPAHANCARATAAKFRPSPSLCFMSAPCRRRRRVAARTSRTRLQPGYPPHEPALLRARPQLQSSPT